MLRGGRSGAPVVGVVDGRVDAMKKEPWTFKRTGKPVRKATRFTKSRKKAKEKRRWGKASTEADGFKFKRREFNREGDDVQYGWILTAVFLGVLFAALQGCSHYRQTWSDLNSRSFYASANPSVVKRNAALQEARVIDQYVVGSRRVPLPVSVNDH